MNFRGSRNICSDFKSVKYTFNTFGRDFKLLEIFLGPLRFILYFLLYTLVRCVFSFSILRLPNIYINYTCVLCAAGSCLVVVLLFLYVSRCYFPRFHLNKK